MSEQIIQQPNGLYAIWDTIVDDFTHIDCQPHDIIAIITKRQMERITEDVQDVIKKLKEGNKPYYQSTMSYEDCLGTIKETHSVSQNEKSQDQ